MLLVTFGSVAKLVLQLSTVETRFVKS